MERRGSERKIVSIHAELIADSARYEVFIENMSKEGIYIVTNPEKTNVDFTTGKRFNVKFQTASGEVLNLKCKVQWIYKTPPHGLTYSVGMEIIAPPAPYKEFFQSLE
jgi:hypothetical protein